LTKPSFLPECLANKRPFWEKARMRALASKV
jgi:hypothetical protein